MFHDQEISNKLLVIENYLFKCVWYKVIPPYDFIDKMCKMRKIGVLFEKISMFVLFFNVIKWSPIIREGYVNVYNHPDFIEYKKIPFTKYKFYYNKPRKIKTMKSKMKNKEKRKSHIKEKNRKSKESLVGGCLMKNIVVLSIIFIIGSIIMDYTNFPSFLGFQMLNMNWNFVMGILNCMIVVILYVVTYSKLDKRTVEREKNKRDISILLLKQCYQECKKYVDMLDQETIEKYIVPKIDFNSTKNTIIVNLQESPFLNENVIMDLVKDGQITKAQVDGYFMVKDKYRQYINMRIICYDGPHLYETLHEELTKIIDTETTKYQQE